MPRQGKFDAAVFLGKWLSPGRCVAATAGPMRFTILVTTELITHENKTLTQAPVRSAKICFTEPAFI